MDAASLAAVEAAAERLYVCQTTAERASAEEALAAFRGPASIAACKSLLDASASPYARLLAASSLLKTVTETPLDLPVRLEMRAYFPPYLESRAHTLPPFVVAALVQLVARLVKLSWYDDDAFRTVADEGAAMLGRARARGDAAAYAAGLKLLAGLVAEFNAPCPGRTLTQHRRVAVSFRDTSLLAIFTTALDELRRLGPPPPAPDAAAADDGRLREAAAAAALACLSFDFVGTCVDESADDLGTIQVPSSWRAVAASPDTPALFFSVHATAPPPLAALCLECLVRLSSVRRSLFATDADRAAFLASLVGGTLAILTARHGLDHHASYHEFCRLLGRLKTNYQLSELVAVDGYARWIGAVAEFTVSSLASWAWAAGSVYYLLALWSRLVTSMPYLKGPAPSLLDEYVPKITRAYIVSRLEGGPATLGSDDGSPLDGDEGSLSDQLDALPHLCRFQYAQTADLLKSLFDPLAAAYADAGRAGTVVAVAAGVPPVDVARLEGQLAWLVHIIAAVVKGRLLSSSSAEAQEGTDGDLAARVFALSRAVDAAGAARAGERSRQRLEMALLSFFQAFRKVYVGEQVAHASTVYARLAAGAGLRDHLAVLDAMLAKVGANLTCFGGADDVIDETLNLFNDLSSGYMSGKLLLQLDGARHLLAHHTAAEFPFLADPRHGRARTALHTTLARLLFAEDTPPKFRAFVAPVQAVLAGMAASCSGGADPAALRAAVPAAVVAGAARDLRGLVAATNSKRTYGTVFDWLHPAHTPVLRAAVAAWAPDPAVCVPLLKLYAELVLNKAQRLTFDASSPNGILLFREVSAALVAYGARALATPIPTVDPYTHWYKGAWVCLTALTRALSGSYVNFAVFDLYGDRALADALDVALRLALAIPLPDVLAHKKVAKAYYGLLDVLAHGHAPALAARDGDTLAAVVASLDAGLKSLDASVSSQCAAAVDALAGFYFRGLAADPPHAAAAALGAHLAARPDLFPGLLATLFDVALFEDCPNQWSLSRPMLPLILVNEGVCESLTARVVAAQPPDRRAPLAAALAKLMDGVARSLEPKNRDKFTQNLTLVRHEIRTKG